MFLVFYNLHRRHNGLNKGLNIKNPLSSHFEIVRNVLEIYQKSPLVFQNKIICLCNTKFS